MAMKTPITIVAPESSARRLRRSRVLMVIEFLQGRRAGTAVQRH
jgi:hypothetical protein